MSYDFLGLVNDVNTRLNEVHLTESNFSSATGFYNQAKEAVNSSVRYINQSQHQWPFNHIEQEETLSAGIVRYGLPADAKTIDYDSFRIIKNASLNNETVKLRKLSYEEYLEKFVDLEYETSTGVRDLPDYIVQTQGLEYAVVPPPDKDYEIVYEYFRYPVDLINATDIPNIPERFRHVIVDGAMHYAYLFRSNSQDAVLAKQRLDEGVKHMRTLLTNRTEYMRSTAITANRITNVFLSKP